MKRILTAIVALPILLFTIWSQSPYFFIALTVAAVVVALGEFYRMGSKVGCKPQAGLGFVAAALLILSFSFSRPEMTVAALILLTVLLLAAAALRPSEMEGALRSIAVTAFGVIYVGAFAGCLAGVRMIPDNASGSSVPHLASKLLTMFFALVIMTDTGAYYVGRSLGRHKLAPQVSPGKTIEGAIGGLVMAMITGYLCKLTFFPEIPTSHALVMGVLIGVIGQIGDLAESLLKRGAGVKDSGHLLPGHGGMLDRIDSILFCAPLLYYYSRLFASKL